MPKAKVIFMGTPDFAVPPLQRLIETHDVVAVVTQPDRPLQFHHHPPQRRLRRQRRNQLRHIRRAQPIRHGGLAVMVTYHLAQAGLVAWLVTG